jgi:hypothetical protein
MALQGAVPGDMLQERPTLLCHIGDATLLVNADPCVQLWIRLQTEELISIADIVLEEPRKGKLRS